MSSLLFGNVVVQRRRRVPVLWGIVFAVFLTMIVSASASRSIQRKLDAIVIPQVNFSGMELTRVLEVLSELSVEFDSERVGVNIVPLFDPTVNDPRVNISLRNLSLKHILNFVTQQVNFSYAIGVDHVSVSDPSDLHKPTPIDPYAAPVDSAVVDPFAAPAPDYDLNGANLLQNLEDLKICAIATLAVIASRDSDASIQDTLNSNALVLLTETILYTVAWQSTLSEEGELTTLQFNDIEWNFETFSKQLLKKVEETSDSDDLHPSWIVFLTLIEEGNVSWRYADAPVIPEVESADGSDESKEQSITISSSADGGDSPLGNEELANQSRVHQFLQTLGISLFSIKYLVVGVILGFILGAFPFVISRLRKKPVSQTAVNSLPQKPRPRPVSYD
ncbi:hypothetical protein ACWPKS_02435 [Coraliomargarita sp. W4R72]